MNPFNNSAPMGQGLPAANNPINPGQVQTTMPSGNGPSETQAAVPFNPTPEQRQRWQQHHEHGRQLYGYILSLRREDKLLRLEFVHRNIIEERKQRLVNAQERLAKLEELEIATNRHLGFAYSSHQNRPGDEVAVQWMQSAYLQNQKNLKKARHSLQTARMHLEYSISETLELFEVSVRTMFGLTNVDPYLNVPGYARNTKSQQMGQMAPLPPPMNSLAVNPIVANPPVANSFHPSSSVYPAEHGTYNTMLPGSYNPPLPSLNSQRVVNWPQPAVAIPNQTAVQYQRSHFEIWPGWVQEPPVAETPAQSPPIDADAPFNLERYLDHRAAAFEVFGADPIYNEKPPATANNTNDFTDVTGTQGNNGHYNGNGGERANGSDEVSHEGTDESGSSDESSDETNDETNEESDGEEEWEKPDDESDDEEEDDDALSGDLFDL